MRDRSIDWNSSRRYVSNRNRSSSYNLKLSHSQASNQISNDEYMDLEYPDESNT